MNATIAKWFFIAGTMSFADWLLMIVFAVIAKTCHAGNKFFFCSTYCTIGIILLLVTILSIPFVSTMIKKNRN